MVETSAIVIFLYEEKPRLHFNYLRHIVVAVVLYVGTGCFVGENLYYFY